MQVKSASGANWVRIQKAFLEDTPKMDLFLAVVLVPKRDESPFEFYILTHREACDAYGKQRRTRLDGLPYKPGFEGIGWRDVKPHLSRRSRLPK